MIKENNFVCITINRMDQIIVIDEIIQKDKINIKPASNEAGFIKYYYNRGIITPYER